MNKMKRYFVIIAMMVAVAACTNTQQKVKEEQKAPTLMDEVMALHDEVMPKMGKMMKVQKQLNLLADSIATVDLERAGLLRGLAQNLDDANEAMMDWMRNFNPNVEGTEAEVKAYLEQKKTEIAKVAVEMNGALTAGQKGLE
jgi:lipoprotein NlpI